MSALEPVYLMAGTDRPKITRAVHRLRDRIGEDAVEQLDAAATSGEEAVAACNALGLFGDGARLVLVEGVERWKAPDAKAIGAYAKNPAPGTVLALVGGELKKDSTLAKAVARSQVMIWDVPKRDLMGWVADQFELLGARADRDACRALVGTVGDDLQELTSEVHKLSSWADGEPIGADDVARLAAGRAQGSPFALTDAWGRRDLASLLDASESLFERSADPNRMLAQLANHVAKVRACRALDDAGVRPRDAAGRLKMHPYAAEKAFEQARNYSEEELRAATVRLAAVDVALKGGSRLSGELELERALVEITRRPEAARQS